MYSKSPLNNQLLKQFAQNKFKPLRNSSSQDWSFYSDVDLKNSSKINESFIEIYDQNSNEFVKKSLCKSIWQSINQVKLQDQELEQKFQTMTKSAQLQSELNSKRNGLNQKDIQKKQDHYTLKLQKWKKDRKIRQKQSLSMDFEQNKDKINISIIKSPNKPLTFTEFKKQQTSTGKLFVSKIKKSYNLRRSQEGIPFYERLYKNPQQRIEIFQQEFAKQAKEQKLKEEIEKQQKE